MNDHRQTTARAALVALSASTSRSVRAIALRTCLIYAFFAALWIILSDRVLVALVPDPAFYAQLATYKGWAFVVITAALLYDAMRRQLQNMKDALDRRHRAEEASRESEERFQQVVENIHEVFWMSNADSSQILYISPGYEHVWGRSCQSLYESPRTWVNAIHPGDRANVLHAATTKQIHGDYDIEYRIIRPDGKVRWIHDRGFPIRNANGAVYRVAGLAEDITSRKHAEQELQSKTAFLEAQVDSSDSGILVVNPEGKKLLQNERMTALWKIPPHIANDEDDKKQVEYVTGRVKDPDGFVEKVRRLYSHPDETSRDEVELIDGTILDRYSCPVIGKGGTHYGRVWFFHDITERKRAEETRARLATAVQQAAEAILITDPFGAIIHVNPAFEKTTGYCLAEVIGKNPRILRSGKHDKVFYNHMWETIKRGEVWSGRITNKKKSGVLYEEEMTISPVFDTAGKLVNYVSVKRDVTREASLEAQLRQAQKMEAIGQLAGGVAHDFNNILTIIQGNATLLLEADDFGMDPQQRTECGRQIVRAAERAAGLTRQLLMFSRKQVIQPADLNMNEVVGGMTKMLQRILGEDIVLLSEFAPKLPLIRGDAGMMEQVLLNLAVNSRDAMPAGGRLTITTAVENLDVAHPVKGSDAAPVACVHITVTDSGSGIPPEVLPRIFEPFFTTKEVGKGTGLGLATVHGIVEQHHGLIKVESKAGKGTTFNIYLPAIECRQTPNKAAAPAAPPGGAETILFAEDEPHLRALVVNVLERLGYTVFQAVSGVAALEIWKQHKDEIDLLLTDMVMPDGMTGRELAEKIVSERPGLKVIYTSGYTAEVSKGLSVVEGFNFLQKPFSPAKLAHTVRKRIDHCDARIGSLVCA